MASLEARRYDSDNNIDSNPKEYVLDSQSIPAQADKTQDNAKPPNSNDASRTSSFSSVKEDAQGVTQSFLVSSRSRDQLTEDRSVDLAKWSGLSPLLPDDGYAGLGPIEEDALSLGGLSRRSTCSEVDHQQLNAFQYSQLTLSPVELLPTEILEQVLEMLALDIPPQEAAPRNTDLVACLSTCRRFNGVATNILYRHITLPHSYVFSKFLNRLSANPELGRLVRRLDLSHFSSIGLGRTGGMNAEIQNLTANTLLRCMELAPNLRELLLQEHLDQDINEAVLRKALYGLPKLQSLDLCACYVGSFAEAFPSALTQLWSQPNVELGIENLSLHDCFTIRGSDLELLLSHLPRLKILDIYHTQVTDKALHTIQNTAQLTHLNIGHCSKLTGSEVTDFLINHPAARKLVYLNLSCDVTRHRLLRYAELDRLLPALPTTLRSLNLGGAQIDPTAHMPHLYNLSKHLEELGLGSTNLSMADVKSFFLHPPSDSDSSSTHFILDPKPSEAPCTLRFLDLTSNPTITQPSLFFDSSRSSRIDAGTPSPTPFLLKTSTLPLEVIELGKPVLDDLKNMKTSNKRFGWLVKELGRRGWYVRERGSVATAMGSEDPAGGRMSGERWWKMGCRSWGMKKVPVVRGHVGGLYGHCMFKK